MTATFLEALAKKPPGVNWFSYTKFVHEDGTIEYINNARLLYSFCKGPLRCIIGLATSSSDGISPDAQRLHVSAYQSGNSNTQEEIEFAQVWEQRIGSLDGSTMKGAEEFFGKPRGESLRASADRAARQALSAFRALRENESR